MLTLCFPAAARAAAPRKVASLEGITEYRLDNGLQVLLYPDPSKPTVTVNLTVLVGSRHEGYGETGMAHLLEHMLFKGTPTHPQIPKALQERGARFNGTTWVDRTNYYETLPATDDNLEFALKLEADRLVNSYVRQEDLFSEMTVVRNEFEMGENSPVQLLDQRIMSVAFDWHNYGKSTIGNRSDIERVPINRLKDFYVKYYQPDNAMLVVAGKFDEAKTLAYIQKYFGGLTRPKRKLDKTYTEEPAQDGERTVTLRRVGDVGMAGAAYHVPAGPHADVAPLEVLAEILQTPPSGRLYKALVEPKKASDVGAAVSSWHDAGVFQVQAEVRREGSLEAARDIMLAVTEGVGDKGVSKEEVDRAKQRILKERELSAADTSRIAVRLSDWAAQGDWRLYLLHRDRIEKVAPQDIQDVAKKYLVRNNRTVGLFVATAKTERTPVPERPDLVKLLKDYRGRSTTSLGESFDVAPMSIQARVKQSTLPEKIHLALLPKKTRGESVQARITLRYGTPENLKGYETAADVLPHLMLRGTKNLTRQQILDALDKNQAVIEASPRSETGIAVFVIETKRAKLPAVLELMRQILREATLPASELDIFRQQQLAGLEQQLSDPHALAMIRLRRTVSPYPKGDVRYIPTVEEEIERFKHLDIDKVKSLYRDYLGSQAGEIAVVGDFDPEPCTAKLRESFTNWSGKEPYARIPRKVFAQVPGGTQEISTPDKANAVYTSGTVFPLKDSDSAYAPMVVGNYVFGGASLASRLADRVRQKDGLSYGVVSQLGAESLDPRASLTVMAICAPQNIKKVDIAIREELARLLKDGVAPEELDRAKRGYLQQQQVGRSSDVGLASILSDNLFVGRTMKYYEDLEKQIERLTAAEILAAFRKYVEPDRIAIVLAGDFPAATARQGAQPKERKR